MAGYNQESSKWSTLNGYGFDLINEDFPSLSTVTGEPKTLTDGYSDWSVRGAFYRINYNWKDRYMVEANGRYDGSSRFPKENRFGFFPSFSVGWNVARENFMEPYTDIISELKPRASWGQIGNQAIGNYAFMPTMGTGKAGWIMDGVRPLTLGAPGLVRDNFTWETVETLDVGIDVSMLRGRLRGTFDWYQRDTKGMLAPGAQLPAILGTSAPLQNVADLRTKGWELELSWRDRIDRVGYNIGFNLYDSRTHITKYDNESGLLSQYRVGQELGEIWGFVTDGYYTVDDFTDIQTWQLKEGVVTVNGVNPRPGDIKYKNLRDDENSTNRIDYGNGTEENPGDQQVIGNSRLRFQFGLTMGVNYAGFDLSVLLQGVGKRDVWMSDARRWAFSSGQFGQIFADQLDYWKPRDPENGDWTAVNPDAEYFRIYEQRQNAGYNTRTQTKYLLDGSYLRIKDITLGYSIPRSLLQKIEVSGVKTFISAENIHTFTSLPDGYDPERLNWGYPLYSTISFGINVTL